MVNSCFCSFRYLKFLLKNMILYKFLVFLFLFSVCFWIKIVTYEQKLIEDGFLDETLKEEKEKEKEEGKKRIRKRRRSRGVKKKEKEAQE